MGKRSDYDSGRMDGLLLAQKIVHADGIEALDKEIKFRGAYKIHSALATKELDAATEQIKQITYETMMVAVLSVVHDEFGFGQKRCQRLVDRFSKLTSYLDKGWLFWMDLIESIEKDLKLKLDFRHLTKDTMGRSFAHPEPEDLYQPEDLLDEESWKAVLRQLHFTERQGDRKEERWIVDKEGRDIMHYEGVYNQIQVYDCLQGMIYAADYWDIEL